MVSLRKFAIVLILSLVTNFAFASNMSCDLRMYVADYAGLVHPSAMAAKISTPLLESAKVIFEDSKNSLYADVCSQQEYEGKNIFMCAVKSDFVGGYETFLMTPAPVDQSGDFKFPQVLSTVIWGTSSQSNELVYLSSDTFIFRDIADKFSQASIVTTEKIKGDSAEVDEATRKAVELGVIEPGEPIYVDITDCKIEE